MSLNTVGSSAVLSQAAYQLACYAALLSVPAVADNREVVFAISEAASGTETLTALGLSMLQDVE